MLPDPFNGTTLRQTRIAHGELARESGLFAAAEALQDQWRLDEAERLIRAAEGSIQDRARAHFVLSILAMQQGLSTAAFEEAALAEQLDPLNRAIRHHALTLEKLRDPHDPESFLAKHRLFGADFAGQEANLHVQSARSSDPDRTLRVAYLTPDAHLAMARFIECIRLHHDQSKFDVSLYYAFPCDLAALQLAYPRVRHVSVAGMGNQQVAELLVGHGIDIAIDLAGHGAGNQLLALQRRPAPIQMTWLDYVATTGIPAIDYRVADDITDPPGSEAWSTETPLRLPVAAWCYSPHPAAPAPRADLPIPHDIVLGSPCVPLKLSDAALACWTLLLTTLPQSRLRLLGVPEGKARERIRSALAGIDPNRVEIIGRLPIDAYYRAINEFDIALDPGPFSGATTTLDCLWQGVPVVTIPGALPHGRSTASILAHAGVCEWVASDIRDFIRIVTQLAGDGEARSSWRRTARDQLLATALFDGTRFVGALETALRAAWRRYVEPPHSAVDDESTPYNHRADRLAARGFDAMSKNAFPKALAELGAVLRQAPAWPKARAGYWSAAQALARARDAVAFSKRLTQVDIVQVTMDGAGSAHAAISFPNRASPARSIAVHAGSEHDAYALAAATSSEDWILFSDARCTHWWSVATAEIDAALREFDALSSIGIARDRRAQLAGARVHSSQATFIGRIWPFRGWTCPATLLCGNWLLVRTSLLSKARDVPRIQGLSPAPGLNHLGGWHASLTLALAADGARLAVCPALLGVDSLDDAEDLALARWQHGLVAGYAPNRERIDVGRLFGVRQSEVAALLVRTLQTNTIV